MLGINLIGKIYKSKKIKTLTNGFEMETKFKSNFGGIKDLKMKVIVRGGFIDVKINHSILLDSKNYEKVEIFQNEDYILLNIGSDLNVQNIIRPDTYNLKKNSIEVESEKTVKNGMYIPLIVMTTSNHLIVVDLYLLPTVYENKEYIELKLENTKDVRFYIEK